jgi:chromosome segregation ATPase
VSLHEKQVQSNLLEKKVQGLEKQQEKFKSIADRHASKDYDLILHENSKLKHQLKAMEDEKDRMAEELEHVSAERKSLKLSQANFSRELSSAKATYERHEKKLKEELKELAKLHSQTEEKLNSEKIEFKKSISAANSKLETQKEELGSLKSSFEKQRQAYLERIKELESDLEVTERSIFRKDEQMEQLKEKAKMLENEISERKKSAESLKKEFDRNYNTFSAQKQQECQNLSSEIKSLSENLSKVNLQLGTERERCREANLKIEQLEKSLQEAKGASQSKEAESSTRGQMIDKLQRELLDTKENSVRLQEILNKRDSDLRSIQRELSDKVANMEDYMLKNQSLEENLTLVNAKCATLEDQLDKAKVKFQELENDLKREQSSNHYLQKLEGEKSKNVLILEKDLADARLKITHLESQINAFESKINGIVSEKESLVSLLQEKEANMTRNSQNHAEELNIMRAELQEKSSIIATCKEEIKEYESIIEDNQVQYENLIKEAKFNTERWQKEIDRYKADLEFSTKNHDETIRLLNIEAKQKDQHHETEVEILTEKLQKMTEKLNNMKLDSEQLELKYKSTVSAMRELELFTDKEKTNFASRFNKLDLELNQNQGLIRDLQRKKAALEDDLNEASKRMKTLTEKHEAQVNSLNLQITSLTTAKRSLESNYQAKTEELSSCQQELEEKSRELSMLRKTLQNLQLEQDDLKKQFDKEHLLLTEHLKTISELEKVKSELEFQINDLEKAQRTNKELASTLTASLGEAKSEIAKKNEIISGLMDEQNVLNSKVLALQEKNETLSISLESSNVRISQLKDILGNTETSAENFAKKLELEGKKAMELESKISHLEVEINDLQASKNKLEALNASLHSAQGESAREIENLKIEKEEVFQVNKGLEQKVEAQKLQINTLLGELENKNKHIQECHEELQRAQESIDSQTHSSKKLLEELQESHQTVAELNSNIQSLSDQAEITRLHLKQEIEAMKAKLNESSNKISLMSQEIREKERDLEWADGENKKLSSELLALKKDCLETENLLDSHKKMCERLQVDLERVQSEKMDLDEKFYTTAAKLESTQLDVERLESLLKESKRQISLKEQSLEGLQFTVDMREDELTTLREEALETKGSLETALNDIHTLNAQLKQNSELHAKEISQLKTTLESKETILKEKCFQLDQSEKHSAALKSQLERELKERDELLSNQNQKLDELSRKLTATESKYSDEKTLQDAKLHRLQEEMQISQQAISQLNSEIESKKSEISEYELLVQNLQEEAGAVKVECSKFKQQLSTTEMTVRIIEEEKLKLLQNVSDSESALQLALNAKSDAEILVGKLQTEISTLKKDQEAVIFNSKAEFDKLRSQIAEMQRLLQNEGQKYEKSVRDLTDRLSEKSNLLKIIECQLEDAKAENERFEIRLSNETSSRDLLIKSTENKLREKLKICQKLEADNARYSSELKSLSESLEKRLVKEVEERVSTAEKMWDQERATLQRQIAEMETKEQQLFFELDRLIELI